MNAADHERALSLMTESSIEGISPADEGWLSQHLVGCAECNAFAGTLGLARQALCSIPVRASDELVAATKARVRIRALELRERAARTALVSLSAAIGMVFSSASLYYAWPFVNWLEARFDLPAFVVEPGFVITWFLPTTIAAAVIVGMSVHSHRPRPLAAEAAERH